VWLTSKPCKGGPWPRLRRLTALTGLAGHFNKIKHFRRIATRHEKTAHSFAAMLFLVGATIWLR